MFLLCFVLLVTWFVIGICHSESLCKSFGDSGDQQLEDEVHEANKFISRSVEVEGIGTRAISWFGCWR